MKQHLPPYISRVLEISDNKWRTIRSVFHYIGVEVLELRDNYVTLERLMHTPTKIGMKIQISSQNKIMFHAHNVVWDVDTKEEIFTFDQHMNPAPNLLQFKYITKCLDT